MEDINPRQRDNVLDNRPSAFPIPSYPELVNAFHWWDESYTAPITNTIEIQTPLNVKLHCGGDF